MKRNLHAAITVLSCLIASLAYGKVVVEGTRVIASTATAVATFEGPALVSLKPAGAEVEFIHQTVPGCALDVAFAHWAPLGHDKHETVTVHALSKWAATVTVNPKGVRSRLGMGDNPKT